MFVCVWNPWSSCLNPWSSGTCPKNGQWEQQTLWSLCNLFSDLSVGHQSKVWKTSVSFLSPPAIKHGGLEHPTILAPPARGFPRNIPVPDRHPVIPETRHGTQGHLPLLASLACTGHRIAGDDLHGVKGVLLQFDQKLVKEDAYDGLWWSFKQKIWIPACVCVCNNWDRLFSKIDSTTITKIGHHNSATKRRRGRRGSLPC